MGGWSSGWVAGKVLSVLYLRKCELQEVVGDIDWEV